MPEDYFDFRQISEQSEDLDFKNLIKCPHCGKGIPVNSTLCFYCGEGVNRGRSLRPWMLWTGIILLALFLLSFVIGF